MQSMNGLQLVPPALVGLARPLLQSQGIDPNALSSSGEIDPMALLTMAFDKVEIRTALTPPVVIDLLKPTDPKTRAQLSLVQPAIIFTGRAGRAAIAPYGVPSGISPRVKQMGIALGVGVGAALLGLVIFGGAIFRPPRP